MSMVSLCFLSMDRREEGGVVWSKGKKRKMQFSFKGALLPTSKGDKKKKMVPLPSGVATCLFSRRAKKKRPDRSSLKEKREISRQRRLEGEREVQSHNLNAPEVQDNTT